MGVVMAAAPHSYSFILVFAVSYHLPSTASMLNTDGD